MYNFRNKQNNKVRLLQNQIQTFVQIQMALSKQYIKYQLTRFRTRRTYLIFQLFQFLLSIVIIITAATRNNFFRSTIVLILQLILLITMVVDLPLGFLSDGFHKENYLKIKIILLILSSFSFSLLLSFFYVLLITQPIRENKKDDIALIIIIVLRYAVQLFQMVKTIKNTHKNMEFQKKMKEIDLNKTPHVSMVEQNNNDVLQDQILRDRIKKREQAESIEKKNKLNNLDDL